MKTTIDLPDELFHRAKIIAAERRTTFKDLVVQGLQQVTREVEAGNRRQKAQRLLDALDQMQNTEPAGPVNRDEIYDRKVLR